MMKRAALDYARRGWHVIPIWWVEQETHTCGCGNPFCTAPGKHPLVDTGRGLENATCDPEAVEQWWSMWPQANVAIALGSMSGIMALDLDLGHTFYTDPVTQQEHPVDGEVELRAWAESNGVPLPETLMQQTGSGGMHLVFEYPPDEPGVPAIRNCVGWLPGVDVKSNGGYILVAPSGHQSGGVYRWLNDQPPAGLDGLTPHLRLARGHRTGTSGGPSGEQPVYDYREACRFGPRAGFRDDFFNKRAFELRRMDVDYEQAKTEMQRLWQLTEQTPGQEFPWDSVVEKLDRVWRTVEPDPLPAWDPFGPARDESTGSVALPGASPTGKPTDLGNAQRFVDLKKNVIRSTQQTGWHVWDGRRWAKDITRSITQHAVDAVEALHQHAAQLRNTDQWEQWHAWAMTSESRQRVEAMLSLAQGLAPVAISVNDFDQHHNLLCCANGVVDLLTGKLSEHDPKLLQTQMTHVEFDPVAHDPASPGGQAWYTYLGSVTGHDLELIAYLQRAAGYTLTGLTTEEVFFIVYGPKASGKTTFVTALQTILGDMSMSIEADAIMHQRGKGVPLEAVASMFARRLVTTTEPNEGARFNESMVKQLTGGDRVAGRHLYKDRFEFEPTHKLWLATNHAPKVYDDAMWRRIRRVPFPRSVPPDERDVRIKAELKSPRSPISRAALAWAVEGAVLWHAGGLGTATAVELDTAEYEVEEDKFGRFLDDEAEVQGELVVSYRDLYDRYKMWCVREGELPMTGTAFGRKLSERGFQKQTSVRPIAYKGLALKTNANMYGIN
jgi:putative DNA primase/helicase